MLKLKVQLNLFEDHDQKMAGYCTLGVWTLTCSVMAQFYPIKHLEYSWIIADARA
jgi:hypothetical protein